MRRNHGRVGAAEAPNAIRRCLHRLPAGDAESDTDLSQAPPLDLGNLRATADLEETQKTLAEIVAAILARKAIPVVLGGGHETAFGHYLGYVAASVPVGIINLDAHLDVRPLLDGKGHSGSPFRQAMEHPARPLPGMRYSCLGAQPHGVSRNHFQYVRERGGVVRWYSDVHDSLRTSLHSEIQRLDDIGSRVYVSIDADVVRQGDVPGVSAPNPNGIAGEQVIECARLAGLSPEVASLDLVEINPRFDQDGQSARWGALVIWNFLMGLASRPSHGGS